MRVILWMLFFTLFIWAFLGLKTSIDQETIKNQVQDKIAGDTYLQEKYKDMDISDIIMSPTFGNDFADIYDNIVVGDTEQTTVENETTNVDETVVNEDEYQGDRYGDSEREILDSIFQATDVQFNKFRNSIFRVAKETGQAFSTVAEGAAELARQGLSAEETAKRLKASLVLTRISGLGAENL